MKKSVIAAAAAVLFAGSFAPAANAGFTVLTGVSQVTNNDIGGIGGTPGDSFSIGGSVFSPDGTQGGTFATYTPDTPFDPQITGGDLNLFRFNLTGTITGVAANVVTYDGDYLVFYDQNANGEPDEGLRVSAGDFAATATFDLPFGETALFAGTLSQTQGPNNANFADLSYGGSDIVITGAYSDTTLLDGPSPTGTLLATLRQNAVAIPEPASAALFGLALAGAAILRRRK